MMCGISGFLQLGVGGEAAPWYAVLDAMAASLQSRGPDASGAWVDPKAGVGLAHRRLAVIDLSPAGAQPMWSESGRYCIVFNGEVYNFRELADELSLLGASFRSR